MKTKFTREEIERRADEAPEAVRRLVRSPRIVDAMKEIGARYRLHIDQMGIIADIVTLTALGLFPRGKMGALIAKDADVPEEHIPLIVQEINDTIFKPVRRELERVWSAGDEDEKSGADAEGGGSVPRTAPASASAPSAPAAPRAEETGEKEKEEKKPFIRGAEESGEKSSLVRDLARDEKPFSAPAPEGGENEEDDIAAAKLGKEAAFPEKSAVKGEPETPRPPRHDPYREPIE